MGNESGDKSDDVLSENHTHNKELMTGEKVPAKRGRGRPRNGEKPKFTYSTRQNVHGKNTKKTIDAEELDQARIWAMLQTPYGFKTLQGMIRNDPKLKDITKFALLNISQLGIDPDASVALSANKLLLQYMDELNVKGNEQSFTLSTKIIRSEDDKKNIKKEIKDVVKEEAEKINARFISDN